MDDYLDNPLDLGTTNKFQEIRWMTNDCLGDRLD